MNAQDRKDPLGISSTATKGRLQRYLGLVLLGALLMVLVYGLVSTEFARGALPDSLVGEGDDKNKVLVSALSILILSFPAFIYSWYLRNKDTVGNFFQAMAQLGHIERQQLETMHSNSRKLFLNPKRVESRAEGLKELIRLRSELSEGNVREEKLMKRIDSLTSNGVDLRGALLMKASLPGADLQRANFQAADLSLSDLQEASLKGAKLQDANLQGADLSGADLCDANLEVAKLRDANFQGANLSGANLSGADLGNANFEGADLRGANLQGANLEGTNLEGVLMPNSQ